MGSGRGDPFENIKVKATQGGTRPLWSDQNRTTIGLSICRRDYCPGQEQSDQSSVGRQRLSTEQKKMALL
jgi:hypothetical protein